MSNVRKAVAALAGLAAQVVAVGVLHGAAQEWAQLVLAALTAATVYLVPNGTPAV